MNPADELKSKVRPPVTPDPDFAAAAADGPMIAAPPLTMKKPRVPLIRRPKMIAALIILTGAGVGLSSSVVQKQIQKATAQAIAMLRPDPARAAALAQEQAVVEEEVRDEGLSAVESLVPQTDHRTVIKSFLTERTNTLCYADLRQLVPYYNNTASSKNLPAQREMSEAFHKHYGVFLEGFDQFTVLRGAAKDEFLFILSAAKPVNVESIFGIPRERYLAQAYPPGRKQSLPRPHVVPNTANLPLSAGLYDPHTLIIGRKSWVESVFNGDGAPGLREATCLFPATAFKDPGALIIVERLAPLDTAGSDVLYEISVSNFFFRSRGTSTLTLTRHPDARTETFVDQASKALRQQAELLTRTAPKNAEPVIVAKKPAGKDGEEDAYAPQENIGDTEATVSIPEGESMIAQAIENVARTFMSKSPTIELILAAHNAVVNFNRARQTKAEDAMSARTVSDALNLLMQGINGGGVMREHTYKIARVEGKQFEAVSSLLALDEGVGLVFRPNTETVSPAVAELALKARDYRNAELLAALWIKGGFNGSHARDASGALQHLLDWCKGAGKPYRKAAGLPELTRSEVDGVLKLITLKEGKLVWRPGEAGYQSWLRSASGSSDQAQSLPPGSSMIQRSATPLTRKPVGTPASGQPARH